MKNQTLLSLFILMIFSTINLLGQTLERAGSLGAHLAMAEDSSGVLINKIVPKSTSESIGLKAGDIILTINSTEIKNTNEVVLMTKSWKANQDLNLLVNRSGKEVKLKGKIKGKPMETSAFGEVTYGAVSFDKGTLRSILITPKNIKKAPVIFFLQGFSCGSIDYYYNQESVTKQLVEGWVEEGFAVYRVEKPGLGDCINLPDCADIGYNYEVEAFQAALAHLKKTPSIDPDQVFLFGHSLGGVTAPLLAAKDQVKGIINYGSVSTSWYEYLLKILRKQDVMTGSDYATAEENVRKRGALLYEYLVEKKTPQELEKNPAYKEMMGNGLPVRDGNKMLFRDFKFMQEVNDANVIQAFKEANCYVLALHGEFDLHAIDAEWAEHTAKVVNSFHPGKGTWKIVPGTEHGFASVPSMEEYIKMRQDGIFNGKYMDDHFNPEVTKAVVDWIRSLEGSEVKDEG